MGITIYISDYEIAEKQLSLLQFTYPFEPVSQYATLLPSPSFSRGGITPWTEKKTEIPPHSSKGAQNGAFRSSADLGARVRGGVLIVQRLHREHCQYHSMKGKMILRPEDDGISSR